MCVGVGVYARASPSLKETGNQQACSLDKCSAPSPSPKLKPPAPEPRPVPVYQLLQRPKPPPPTDLVRRIPTDNVGALFNECDCFSIPRMHAFPASNSV